MKDKVFNIGLKYPSKIDVAIKLLEDDQYIDILKSVKKLWTKSGKAPTIDVINQTSGLNIPNQDVSEGDLLWLVDEYNLESKEELLFELANGEVKDLDYSDIYDQWQKKIIDVEPPNIITSNSIEDIKRDMSKMQQRYNERVSTGFTQIDELLTKNGKSGFAKQYTYILQGLTGTGKTFFLSNFAVRQMMAGKRVAYISIEMDQWQIRDLIYRSYFNVSDITQINPNQKVDFELTVLNYSNMSHNMFDIQADLNKLSNKPDLVIIDYLDNIAPSRKTQQSWQVQESVAQDMIRVAQEMDLPILTATQTNRNAAGEKGGTKRNIGYEATGSSFNKTHGFAGIWSIVTDDDDYNPETGCREFELVCNKNRDGKQSKTYFVLNYHNAKLYEPSELEGKTDRFSTGAFKSVEVNRVGSKSEDSETSEETIKSYNKYFNLLKDDPNYKQEIKNIDEVYLDKKQKFKLRKEIEKLQIPTNYQDALNKYSVLTGKKRGK